MVTEGVGGCCGLALFDGSLGRLEVVFEKWPSFVGGGFGVPFADVTREDGGSSDDDEADVGELGGRLGGPDASVMFAYSLMAVNMLMMGRAWL